jgi:DNA-binding NarL/FixJ family response regulator
MYQQVTGVAIKGNSMRILIADDHEIIRAAVIRILQSRPDIECAEATNGKEAVEKAFEWKPDLVMLDLGMPSGGLEAARRIAAALPKTRILLLSADDAGGLTNTAKAAGVLGFVRKDQASTTLLKAVDCVLSGHSYFP